MKARITQFKVWFYKQVNKFRSFFPRQLPVGLSEYETWSASIIKAYDLPDNESVRWALANMILHTAPTACDKPGRYYGRSALKSMANQVAAHVIQELKIKQETAAKAAQQAAQVVIPDASQK